jgi:hypothetical protein
MFLASLFQTNAITVMVEFLIFIVIVAIVIIGVRWLMSLAGVSIPQPLIIILGLILFIVFLLIFLNFLGIWSWGMPRLHP